MKVVILAGGFGTRLSEYTNIIPKPMVEIGQKPLLWHLMQSFGIQGYTNFSLALGYKSEVIKDYFHNYYMLNTDSQVDLATGKIVNINAKNQENWKVDLIDTGLNTMTGGRLKRLKPLLNDTFILTYGDGLSNVNIDELVSFHKSHKKMVTVTAVRPVARFGELQISNNLVSNFSEKPQTSKSWINGGFFVINPDFFDYIEDDDTVLEKGPLEKIANIEELMAYKHDGFWQCMDTKRDRDYLETLIQNDNAPWFRMK